MQLVERTTVEHRGLSPVSRAKKNKEAGEAFKKLLVQKGFTNYRLAKETDLGRDHIGRIASGEIAAPEPTTLAKIATVLGIELGELTRIFAQSTVQSQHVAANPQPQKSVSELPISNSSDFVGREDAIAHLNNLVNEGAKVILIHAEGGIGKETLATKWFELQGLKPLDLRVGTTPQNLNSLEDWVRGKLKYDFKENPEQDFTTMLEQLKSKLQEQRIGVLIHHLEFALINGEFIESHNSNYIKLLTVLAHKSVQSVTLITSCELLDEPLIKNFQIYTLEGLKKEGWEKYFASRNISIDTDAIHEMNLAYGGNAFAMSLLSPEIISKSKGNLKDYWQDNRDNLLSCRTIQKLVKRQFDKLKNDNIQAYKLLCRFGFYPNQDITVPEIWLSCLLWDVAKNQQKGVINELCACSLLKFNEHGYYLHTMIRVEAVERFNLLRESNDESLFLIKKQVDSIIESHQHLQHLLVWINKKLFFISQDYKQAAFRAFYLGFFIYLNLGLSNYSFDNDQEYSNLACTLEHTFDIYCKSYSPNSLIIWIQFGFLGGTYVSLFVKCFNLVLSSKQENNYKYFFEQMKYNINILDNILLKVYRYYIEQLNYDYKNFVEHILKVMVEIEIAEGFEKEEIDRLIQNNELQKLRDDFSKDFLEGYDSIWNSILNLNIDDYKKSLMETTILDNSKTKDTVQYQIPSKTCYGYLLNKSKLSQKWYFDDKQKKLLRQYYEANKLLMFCINSKFDISPEVRSHIEDTLLLPIAEIEKRPFKN
ncbi:helix-turn-helix domain-containing protein [Nostoc commune]|uniref:helix-turn-helix domain-containing protein n=1 Tax=Nostoc commune TaxID=1178 RepID=UPI0018C65D93|nr:helix-turn-helix domain-containing protein [Nostoc commune BAE]